MGGSSVVFLFKWHRRAVQQDTLGQRGHMDDPLYEIRGLLRCGRERLSEKQEATLNPCLIDRDPGWGSPSRGTPASNSGRLVPAVAVLRPPLTRVTADGLIPAGLEA